MVVLLSLFTSSEADLRGGGENCKKKVQKFSRASREIFCTCFENFCTFFCNFYVPEKSRPPEENPKSVPGLKPINLSFVLYLTIDLKKTKKNIDL